MAGLYLVCEEDRLFLRGAKPGVEVTLVSGEHAGGVFGAIVGFVREQESSLDADDQIVEDFLDSILNFPKEDSALKRLRAVIAILTQMDSIPDGDEILLTGMATEDWDYDNPDSPADWQGEDTRPG